VKEVAWLTPPPRFCKPLARNLASIQYGMGGAILQWAGEEPSGKLRPPTRRSIRCSCLHRRAADVADEYAFGGMPTGGMGPEDEEAERDERLIAAARLRRVREEEELRAVDVLDGEGGEGEGEIVDLDAGGGGAGGSEGGEDAAAAAAAPAAGDSDGDESA